MTFKDKIETVGTMVTIGAILVGGLWTYKLFIEERKHYPHANIEQKVSHVQLSDRTNLLRVGIELTNSGTSRLRSDKAIVRIQQILPVPPCIGEGPCAKEEVISALKDPERKADRFSWPMIAEREHNVGQFLDIEPGEKDLVEFEFVVPTEVTVVRIYSYFRNDQRSKQGSDEIGWKTSSQYDFRQSKKEGKQ